MGILAQRHNINQTVYKTPTRHITQLLPDWLVSVAVAAPLVCVSMTTYPGIV